ncbi:MAG: hypothetical protein AAB642_03445 [Patescibacteria group bacterium]
MGLNREPSSENSAPAQEKAGQASSENLVNAEKGLEMADDVKKGADDLMATIRQMKAEGYEGNGYAWGPSLMDKYIKPTDRDAYENEVLSRLGVDMTEVENIKGEYQKYLHDKKEYDSQDDWGKPRESEPKMPIKTFSTNMDGVEVEMSGDRPIIHVKNSRPASK